MYPLSSPATRKRERSPSEALPTTSSSSNQPSTQTTLYPDEVTELRAKFAVFSCSNFPFGHFNSYAAAALKDLDIWLHVGDFFNEYATDEGLRALSAAHALFAVPDDHEVADNTWKGGSADSNNTAAGTISGVTFTQRKLAAVQAYHEWMPIRQVDTTDGLRFWRRFQFGRLASFSMLDTRQYERDVTDVFSPSA
ncbi:unnamed protein product [Tilletia controversa]|nr:unnamed protein product [Tilletia controversa]